MQNKLHLIISIILTILLTILVLLAIASEADMQGSRIIGGQPMRQPATGHFYSPIGAGGAVLISVSAGATTTNWALTVAHNLDPAVAGRDDITVGQVIETASVVVGDYNAHDPDGERTIAVAGAWFFGYTSGNCCQDDIALIYLDEPASLTYSGTMPIINIAPLTNTLPAIGQPILYCGWGDQGANVPRRDPRSHCATDRVSHVYPKTVCVAGASHAAPGDSGGPGLDRAGNLIGIVQSISVPGSSTPTCFTAVAGYYDQLLAIMTGYVPPQRTTYAPIAFGGGAE